MTQWLTLSLTAMAILHLACGIASSQLYENENPADETVQKLAERNKKFFATIERVPATTLWFIRRYDLAEELNLDESQISAIEEIDDSSPASATASVLTERQSYTATYPKDFDAFLKSHRDTYSKGNTEVDLLLSKILDEEQFGRLKQIQFQHYLSNADPRRAFDVAGIELPEERIKEIKGRLLLLLREYRKGSTRAELLDGRINALSSALNIDRDVNLDQR